MDEIGWKKALVEEYLDEIVALRAQGVPFSKMGAAVKQRCGFDIAGDYLRRVLLARGIKTPAAPRGRAQTLSDAQLESLAELREEKGWSIPRIQRAVKHRFGLTVSESLLHWQFKRLGIDGPRNKPHRFRKRVIRRNGHLVRRFTPQEDAKILEMRLAGYGQSAIARELGRPSHSVYSRFLTLARREARAEQQPQREAAE
jgi:transposase